jgi:hypothetical protein
MVTLIDYIKIINYYLVVVHDQKQEVLDISFKKYINDLLKSSLVNLKTREKMTKIKYKFKGKIPLYIKEGLLLLCVKSYRNQGFYINYYSILDWEKDQQSVVIYFKDNFCIRLKSYGSFIKQIKKLELILNDHNL